MAKIKLKKYKVEIGQSLHRYRKVLVMAASAEEARELARDKANECLSPWPEEMVDEDWVESYVEMPS